MIRRLGRQKDTPAGQPSSHAHGDGVLPLPSLDGAHASHMVSRNPALHKTISSRQRLLRVVYNSQPKIRASSRAVRRTAGVLGTGCVCSRADSKRKSRPTHFSVEKIKCQLCAKSMICNQALRPSTSNQRRQNDSGHPGIGLEQLSNEGKIILKGDK